MSSTKIKSVFEVVIGVEMSPEGVKLVGGDGSMEPNGKHYLILDKVKAGTVTLSDEEPGAIQAKAVRTACYFYKQNNPDWADSHLVGLSPSLVKQALVR